jgi:hypothetical protein
MPLTANVIRNKQFVSKAQALLYEHYIKELHWNISHNNQSGLRIEKAGKICRVLDDYDKCSTWFSTRLNNQLVSCARLCKNDENGLLEIERYSAATKSIKEILSYKEDLNLIELNREATSTNHPLRKASQLLLLKLIFTYCIDHSYSILTTSNLKDWVEIYSHLSFPLLSEKSFKYSEFDNEPVNVYLAKKNDIEKMLKKITNFLKLEKKHVETPCCIGV